MSKVKHIIIMLIIVALCSSIMITAKATDVEDTEKKLDENAQEITENTDAGTVLYYSHLRSMGWEDEYSKKDGDVSGTEGQNRAIEAIKIKLNNMPEGVTVKYQTHVQDIGWQSTVSDGELAGTTGKAKNVEAIRISLENTEEYSIMYSAHVQDIGWQEWAIDGEMAGTTGKNKKIEAIMIKVVPKTIKAKVKIESTTEPIYENTINVSGWAMANTQNTKLETYIDNVKIENEITYKERTDIKEIGYGGIENTPKAGFDIKLDLSSIPDGEKTLKIKMLSQDGKELATAEKTINIEKDTVKLRYTSHVKNEGWQNWVYNSEQTGTTGKNRHIEAIQINLLGNLPEDAQIKYQVHVKNIGWMDWVSNGEMAGTTGKNLRVEAIRIKLENMEDYSVEYRAHVQNIGWQDWAIDGELAGTENRKLQIEGLEINIIPKTIRANINIDTNLDNQIADEDNLEITGWAMANAQNTKLEAYINDQKADAKFETYARTDVKEIGYGGLENTPNCGFNANIDMTKYSDGKYNLKIKMLLADGTEITSISKEIVVDRTTIGVKYQTHVQDKGWVSWTRGENESNVLGKKIEAAKIKLVGALPTDAKIKYQVHVQDIGWQDWNADGEIAGTTGKNLKIEAFRIELENMDGYSVEYNAYVPGYGWQGWAYDGETAGTTGRNLKIEAVKIRIVNKITDSRTKMYVDSPVMDGVSVVKVTQKATTVRGWAMSNQDGYWIRVLVDGKETGSTVKREARQDVLDYVKGYGGEVKNPLPGFTTSINFANYSVGNHTITVQVMSKNGAELCKIEKPLNIQPDFVFETGIYGISGLAAKGAAHGTALPYYKIGKGPNVMFATFAVHGWEDQWAGDGDALIKIAEDFKNILVRDKPADINNNWTIYIFPGVNRDGTYVGYTNNGPGRTTLYSMAPGNKGIDVNRCWQTSINYKRYTDDRNYNGTVACQAYEASYLRQFLLDHKSTSGQTVLVDLHGWLNETIGDNTVGSFYREYYGLPKHIGTYGEGYLINWARQSLGSNGRAAKSALVELPAVNSKAEADSRDYSGKYYNATLKMLRAIQ